MPEDNLVNEHFFYLIESMKEETVCCRRLTLLVSDQKELLIAGDVNALPENTRLQEKQVFVLTPILGNRKEMLGKLAKILGVRKIDLAGAAKKTPVEVAEEFKNAFEELLKSAKELALVNMVSEKLLDNAAKFTKFTLKTIREGGKKKSFSMSAAGENKATFLRQPHRIRRKIMINSFQPLNTITSGLILQQLEENIDANNISQPSVDSQGYLMNSLEQVNSESNPSITFTGANGLLSIGTGASAESVTRLRSSFLDNQIQQESSVVGYNSVLYGAGGTGVMSEINAILTGSTTISSALSSFTTAWSGLASAANATNVALQNTVVAVGVNLAQAIKSQYTQLKSLQTTVTGQIGQTVIQINQILQQLSNINKQILSSAGSNQNNLLDARDYALDKLSQLTNFQAVFNSTGTVNVWVGDLSLVDASGAAILNANATNYNNTTQSDVTIQSSQGSVTVANASSLFTGGTLGGELNSRDVVIQNYMNQLNETASSVLTMTNNLSQAGYVANSTTTNVAFFTGTNAATIAVNGTLVADSTSSAVPYLPTEVNPSGATGQLAGFLGNIQNLLAGNYLTSANQVAAGVVDPTLSISTQIGAAATGGTFTINGAPVTYTAAQSIDAILGQLNAISGVNAVFNDTTKKFEIFSNTPLTFVGTAGDKFKWGHLESVLISTVPINNILSENDARVDYGNEPLNANYSIPGPPITGPNKARLFW